MLLSKILINFLDHLCVMQKGLERCDSNKAVVFL